MLQNMTPLERTIRLRRMRDIILEHLKPGDVVKRVGDRDDVFLGMFEHKGYRLGIDGWFGKFEFTNVKGHRTKSLVEMPCILEMLGYDRTTLDRKVQT